MISETLNRNVINNVVYVGFEEICEKQRSLLTLQNTAFICAEIIDENSVSSCQRCKIIRGRDVEVQSLYLLLKGKECEVVE